MCDIQAIRRTLEQPRYAHLSVRLEKFANSKKMTVDQAIEYCASRVDIPNVSKNSGVSDS